MLAYNPIPELTCVFFQFSIKILIMDDEISDKMMKYLTFRLQSRERLDLQQEIESVERGMPSSHQGCHLVDNTEVRTKCRGEKMIFFYFC